MLSKLDEAKNNLLARAVEVADHGYVPEKLRNGALAVFLRRYYRYVAPEDVVGRDAVDVYGAAISHYALATNRPQGKANVRVYTPTVEEHGWSSGHTIVEIVTDDMPFLVDSVTAELNRQDRAIHTVIHPQFVVRRDITGALVELLDLTDPAQAPKDAVVESWIHIEIDRESDRAELERIQRNLERVLRDVREVVEDWQKMRQTALRLADQIKKEEPPASRQEVSEATELLKWLADDHFTFLGYREYQLVTENGEELLRPVPGTGLGILRSDQPVPHAGQEVRVRAGDKRLLILTKANSRSSVHKPSYLDYIGLRKFDEQGEVIGERRFLGLFSLAAYIESVTRVPVVKRKVKEVFAESGIDPNSHDGRNLLEILETYPRDELFQIAVPDLVPIALSVLHLQERRRLRLFLRRDEYGRFLSALVYLPRDRFNTEVRLKMQDILLRELGGESIDYTLRSTESVLTRLHFVVRMAPGQELPQEIDAEHIEQRLIEATRRWEDDFAEALVEQCGEEQATALARKYAGVIPEGYKEDFPAKVAVADLRRLEALKSEGDFTMNLYEPLGARPGERRFKIYRRGRAMSLSAVLPVLQRMGVEVVDERPYEFRLDGAADGADTAWVYDFGLRYDPALEHNLENVRELFQEAFAATWSGEAENDGFNALVLRAGLSWRQVMVLRAYAKYLRQAGTTFSQDYIEECLNQNVPIARLLVNLFEARLDPARGAGDPAGDAARAELCDGLVEEINGALDQVASLDQDRILRSFLRLILATLRTNYFQRGGAGNTVDDPGGRPKPYVSFKLDPRAIPDLPQPRPMFEIWVYSPRVEGVHLRFGKVARGGLRWSDRREDFRTEILGLVKAQMVKNAVIVPVGAKGGFVVKNPPADPEARLAEGVACYKTFISGLLDITDNLVTRDGQQVVEPPAGVVRHDGDDPYLVVAADKGTATFSDIANSVAAEYGFWLGDAFASGGSTGYDHKAMGITARGAWESVKRHFRELGIDTQTQDFTVVGIGDMSGDVFGNGMLLSRHIKLVAAFDHRHVFLDPDPDPELSWAERKRLFELPRSSWADYNPDLISPGGGVYPRTAKSIPVSPQVRERLGIPEGVTAMTPHELIRAILKAPVDLLWNGGIGTYVKATTESHAHVGDKANDAIRVNGNELRARVVGEGGNLGFTQLGRIEYALHGGKINTDFIDNSAGVDCSDREVNIKILLNSVVANGDLTVKQRNELLAQMTDEVAELVLRDNYGQNVALASAVKQAPSLLHVHARLMRRMEREGKLDRALEFLPTDRQINERRQAGIGLTQPELAVLLSYVKINLAEELLASDLPEDDFLRGELYRYFPTPLRERFREQIDKHPLRREIITTCVVNRFVNNAGITAMFRLKEETGASAADIARAYTAACAIYDLQSVWEAIEALDNKVDADVQTRMRLESRRLTERVTRWFLHNRRPPLDIDEQIAFFRKGVADVVAHLPKMLKGVDAERLNRIREELVRAHVPEDLAVAVAGMPNAYSALDICEVARDSGRGVIEVAEVYFDLADRIPFAKLLDKIVALPRTDRWKSTARAALRDDLYAAHAALTFDVLACGGAEATPGERFAAWSKQNATTVTRARQTLADIEASDTWDLATLSVALRVIRTMLRQNAMG
ncbi:NAD-glutamate dehydrogenase [Carbonactinospora thermoautotrophica]|uniref:NAD-glutamate dehydrogenase n=2 Tax=Carbonactinospora thermoautotrophica TaxID=1469144 RepID=A0A132N072_9ACTN|nr:NAD-glutamate dehydrogenase [Carbonactinospora thermoautotrophica]KWX03473.1 NAD-glutamate dehydrogenase [Carbonactinospora thermoautotrophica]